MFALHFVNFYTTSTPGDDKNRGFDLLIDERKIATQELQGGITGRFFDVE